MAWTKSRRSSTIPPATSRTNDSSVVTPFDHVKPLWFYVPQVLLGIFPWSLLLLARIRRLCSSPESRFLLVAGIGGLIFVSLAGSKRPVYLVPIYAPLEIATAGLLRTEFRRAFVPVAATMAAILFVGTTCWLPGYSDLHSTPAAVGRQPGGSSKSSLPVAG